MNGSSPPVDDVPERAALARRAAEAGAGVAHAEFRAGIDVETKGGKTDVVTAADHAAQRRVIEVLREAHPDEAIVGEEEGELDAVPDAGPAWIIDPIDGTNNFVRDIPVWATSVAAVVDGEPVAACNVLPALGDTYVADADADAATRNGRAVGVSEIEDPQLATVVPTVWWEFDARDEYARACEAIVTRFADLRRFGSAQAVLSMVADGALEGAITNVRCNPWDSVAGVHLVRLAGGQVTDLDGDRWTHGARGLVASNGQLHDEMLAAARDIEG